MKIMLVFGTRPEAIKMAPLVKGLQAQPDRFETVVCVTAQHREMLDQVLKLFEIAPEHDLNIMKPGQDLFDITANILTSLKPVLAAERPDWVLVHGDTTTTLATSLAAFYSQIRVGHVEAGLRTGNKRAPFPEEINLRLTSSIADLHFAPTLVAQANLLREGTNPAHIVVTGNTVIDALLVVVQKLRSDKSAQRELAERFAFLDPAKRLILVTGHRRENFGEGFQNICEALADIASAHPNVEILYPVHLNPNVRQPVQDILAARQLRNVHLIDPVDYLPFCLSYGPVLSHHHRLRRRAGRSAFSGQAGVGDARKHRAPGSGRRRHRVAGRYFARGHSARDTAPAQRRGRLRSHVARPQSLRRRPRGQAHRRNLAEQNVKF
jgi:UDP-N-acetylglucosamine 2-epimerase (non-hydrolysing)